MPSPTLRFVLLLAAFLSVSANAFDLPSFAHHKAIHATGTIELAFSPEDNATDLIVRAIEASRKQVLVQAFSFTSREISTALIAAKRRGIDVQLIADREQTEKIERNRVAEIASGGVPVLIDGHHRAAHNKVIIIDAGTPDTVLVTGSFNFTYGAQNNNAENVLLFRGNPPLSDAYADNWRRHRSHAQPFRPKHAW